MELWITFGFFGKSALFGEKNDAQRLFFCKKFVDNFFLFGGQVCGKNVYKWKTRRGHEKDGE